MAKSYPPLPCLCGSLRRVERMITRYYDDCLRPSGMTGVQFSLMATIVAQEELTQQRLAEQLQMEKATLSRNLKGMQEAGWIVMEPGEDRRVRTLKMTDTGLKRREEAKPLWDQAQRELQKRLGADFYEYLDLFNGLPERLDDESHESSLTVAED